MRTVSLLSAVLSIVAFSTFAQSVDAGRGEIPLTVPSGYDEGTPTPLIVLLHGYTASGERQESYMKFGKLADEYGFLYFAPDGTKEDSDRASRFWNATDACCNFHDSTVDDSSYIMSLIDQVNDRYNVDPKRVYLIGHSNGGFMSYRMAHDHPDSIAAIASLAGATLSDDAHAASSGPVHVLQIHGTKDRTILYEGGDISGNAYPSAGHTVEQWAKHNGCDTVVRTEGENLDLDKRLEGAETTVTKFTSHCDPNGSVELWTIHGAGHIPSLSDSFSHHVVDWLFAHPKTADHTSTD